MTTKNPIERSFMSFFLPSSNSTVTKRKKPARLEYTPDQVFLLESQTSGGDDTESVYVWIYEAPPSLVTWLLGFALIVGIIACCAFPMWPWQAKQGAYYISLCLLALLGLLLLMAALRICFYCTVLILSLGKLRLWLFPNFFADCGFFESFQPVYSLERVPSAASITIKSH